MMEIDGVCRAYREQPQACAHVMTAGTLLVNTESDGTLLVNTDPEP